MWPSAQADGAKDKDPRGRQQSAGRGRASERSGPRASLQPARPSPSAANLAPRSRRRPSRASARQSASWSVEINGRLRRPRDVEPDDGQHLLHALKERGAGAGVAVGELVGELVGEQS